MRHFAQTPSLICFMACFCLFACSNSSHGTYDPNRKFKEDTPTNLQEIGLSVEIEKIDGKWKEPLYPQATKSLDPLGGSEPKQTSAASQKATLWKNYTNWSFSLFDEGIYAFNPHLAWFADISPSEDGVFPCFFSGGEVPRDVWNASNLPYLDAVFSNGVWSYIANFTYTMNRRETEPFLAFANGLSILYAIEKCTMDDYPYTIYMDSRCLYFMSKDTAFPNDYIEEFNKREDMHLLYV